MVSMIAFGVIEALKHPDQLALLVQEPDKWVPRFVDELCRYHTASAMATKRVAKEDIVLAGKKIKAEEGIIAATMSGNRDEEIWQRPNEFDMRRKEWVEGKEALGFGWGQHRCVAEWLAKAEMEICFGEYFLSLLRGISRI